ncbi:hypothetical protein [Dickeya solani]|uniref:hypothetical protein n=1 Tax=Dickeya solani TaxID=1089444 RepID=UPI001E545D51|nr:hypothetical protein [Dickeya solani]
MSKDRYPLSSYVAPFFDRPPGSRLDPMLRTWLECIVSPAGQAVVAALTHRAEGYVPLEETMLVEQKRVLALLSLSPGNADDYL